MLNCTIFHVCDRKFLLNLTPVIIIRFIIHKKLYNRKGKYFFLFIYLLEGTHAIEHMHDVFDVMSPQEIRDWEAQQILEVIKESSIMQPLLQAENYRHMYA